MTVPFWPLDLPQCPMRDGLSGARQGYREVFQPDQGKPITRPRGTGSLEQFSLSMPPMSGAQLETFDTFFQTTLGQGSKEFVWRHPLTRTVRWFKMVPGDQGYGMSPWGRSGTIIRFDVLVLPAAPWFADYVPDGVSRAPYFVADYANGIYGIDGATVAASALPTISGTYWVQRTTTTTVTEAQETLVATDIPATAPAGTTKIIGFET